MWINIPLNVDYLSRHCILSSYLNLIFIVGNSNLFLLMNGAILPGENSKWDKTCTSAPELSETPSSSYNLFWKTCADFNLYCLLKISFGSHLVFNFKTGGEEKCQSLASRFLLGQRTRD